MAGLLAAGDTLHGRYTIEAVVRTGRRGAIYLGRDTQGAAKAVSIREGSDPSPEAQDAFQREVQTLSALEHPSLPVIIDHFVEPSGRQYLVYEQIEGLSAAEMVNRSGPFPEVDLFVWFDRVLAAVEYLHAQRPPIIHGGISPSSIILTERGTPHLVDLAGVDDGEFAGGAEAGSPYMPPEQHLGQADERSDIYALGATLYMLLTGTQPPTPLARAGGQQLTPPRQLNGAISGQVDAAILRAMALEPLQRFATPSEMWQALLKRAPGARPVVGKKALPVAAGVAGVALAAALLLRVIPRLVGLGQERPTTPPTQTARPVTQPTQPTQAAALITLMPPTPLVADTVVPTLAAEGVTATVGPTQEAEGVTATVEPTQGSESVTATFEPTQGPEAIPPTATATGLPTRLPPTALPTERPAATATSAPKPTRAATATESPRQFRAPAPISPAPGSSLSGEVQFSWYWPEVLQPDERFDLQVYHPGDVPSGIAWCTETTYRTSQLPAGGSGYLWRVQVVKVSGGQVVGYVTEPSVEVSFTWH